MRVSQKKNQAIILLNTLSESYRDLRATMQYGRTSLSLEDVVSALRSRGLEEDKKDKKINNVEGLSVKVKREQKPKPNGKGNSRERSISRSNSKSRGPSRGSSKTRTCWYYKKEGHLRKNYFKRKKGLRK